MTPLAACSSGESLAVGRRRRVDHQAAHVADVRDVAVRLERLHEALPGLETADDLEGQHRARTARRVLARVLAPRAALEAGVRDPLDLVATLEPGGDGLGVGDVPLDAQAERLDPLREQEAVERRDRRSEVAQRLHARLEDVREVRPQRAADAEVAAVDETVVLGSGWLNPGNRSGSAV
ncbi:hypothetical protein GCM10025868_44550 [Angustibacter aerolatus]|uniref:DUF222 domain-containing protein n=1 Tax=Angustibacter aerolatus TaxID=1162965 RepID=A0ABQ6JLR0_9ACTN|nr:hypothetical protein GCM10025868_44550 [Angustibacter aerolatus]